MRIILTLLARPFAIGFMAYCLFTQTGCVTAEDGSRKFNPWEAAKKADDGIDNWLDRRRGFESSRPALWE